MDSSRSASKSRHPAPMTPDAIYSLVMTTSPSAIATTGQLRASGMTLLDVQWLTPHLATLGATEVPRAHYLILLQEALAVPTTFTTEFAHG